MPNYWEATLLASLYAKVLAGKLPSAGLSPAAAEGLNLIHDFGRVMSPDQYYRNDLLMDRFATRVGFRDGALDQLPSLKKILGLSPGVDTYADHTPAQRILHVADWLGKRNHEGELVKVEGIVSASNASFDRYRKLARWTSTLAGIDGLKRGQPVGEHIFRDEVAWLEGQGIDLESVRQEVQALSETDANKSWLLDAINAQETLDPRADAALHRPPIRYVIWDVGGVLFKDSQADLYAAMGQRLGVSKEAIAEAVESTLHSPDIMSDAVKPETYLAAFFKHLGIKGLDSEAMVAAFQHPHIHRPAPGMQELVEALSHNPTVQQSVLSDTISVAIPPMMAQLAHYYPQIDGDVIYVSGDIGASKQDPGGGAFTYTLEKLGIDDPQSAVFIDDRDTYTTRARRLGLRALTLRGNPYRHLTAAERLQHEFAQAGLTQ